MKIGMNLLLWTGGVTAEHFPLLAKLKAAGFDGVELPVFGGTPAEPYSIDLLTHPLSHISTWGGELLGVAILVWFVVAFRLGERDRTRSFLQDGLLRP